MAFKRLQEQAYDYLKEQILADKFEPGVIYSETKISEEMGISRTPTREALQRLSHDGFLDIMPSKGFRLHQLTMSDVVETYQMRCAIEGFCANLLAKQRDTRAGRETLQALKSLLDQQEQCLAEASPQCLTPFLKLDHQFHFAIIAYAENGVFNNIYTNQMYKIDRIAVETFTVPGRLKVSYREHVGLYEAIHTGGPEAVYARFTDHYNNLMRTVELTGFLSNTPEMNAMR